MGTLSPLPHPPLSHPHLTSLVYASFVLKQHSVSLLRRWFALAPQSQLLSFQVFCNHVDITIASLTSCWWLGIGHAEYCVGVLSHPVITSSLAMPWTAAHQAPLSVGFSRQECWAGLPCPPPGDLPDPGIEPLSQASPALAGRFFTTSTTWEAQIGYLYQVKILVSKGGGC